VPKIGCKDVAKCTHAALAPLRLGFSLILGRLVLGSKGLSEASVFRTKNRAADVIDVA
jgi:hypothetical protein